MQPCNWCEVYKKCSFNSYVKLYRQESDEIFDEEHVAFLLLWLSAYVFDIKLVTIAKSLKRLANLLHECTRLSLGQCLLANLYNNMDTMVDDIRNQRKSNIGGTILLLQLWWNAMLEKQLAYNPPSDLRVITCGSHLCYYSPESVKGRNCQFCHFLNIFYSISSSSDRINYAPFIEHKYGPS